MKETDWQRNEFQQVGTDFADISEVERYDERMETFRDFDAESHGMLSALKLPSGSAILDIGCGTGRFARYAAAAGFKVSCADVSSVMLEYVRDKVAEEGLPEITTQHAGFLTMDFAPDSFDAVVSGAALHHLPDLWKFIALRNIIAALKPDGQFILRDVVFRSDNDIPPENRFERFSGGFPDMRKEAARHIANEFSTYDWIMEGLLVRASFEIISAKCLSDSFIVYHCRKNG